MIIAGSGNLFMLGKARDGQLGRGGEIESNAGRTEPKEVNFFSKQNLAVEEIALGNNHCLALSVKKI